MSVVVVRLSSGISFVSNSVAKGDCNTIGLNSFFCFSSQQVQFNTTFYASPVVLVSVHHDYDRKVKNRIPPEYNIITAWVEVRHNSLWHVYQQQFGPRYSPQ